MGKIKLIGSVIECKATTETHAEYKVLVNTSKKSYYLLRVPLQYRNLDNKTIEVSGNFETILIGGSEVLLVTANVVHELSGNVMHKSEVYNVVGFFANGNGKLIQSNQSTRYACQSISVFKDENKKAYYDIVFWGEYGVSLFEKGLLDNQKVARVLIAGNLVTEYKKVGEKSFFNKRISITDFVVLDYKDKAQPQNIEIPKSNENEELRISAQHIPI